MVLEQVCLKKSKIILRYSFYLISIIYVLLIINNNITFKKYHQENKIEGIITYYQVNGDYVLIHLKGKEKVIVYYKNNDLKLELGMNIEVFGELNEPSKNTNFNLFNYQNYLLSKKIYHTFYAEKIKVKNKSVNIFYKVKNLIIKRINKSKNKNYLELFVLGNNNLDEMKSIYQSLGISHLFAISGMHITLLTSVLYKLLNKLNKNKKTNFIIISLFLLFYMFLTNYTASVLRASFLFILINLKKILKTKIDNIHILLIIFFGLLDYNPYYLYDLGFLFSFCISYALIKYNYLINKYHNYFIKVFVTSLISFTFSLPIIMLNINSFNLLSPLINCLFVPFVSLIVFPLSLINLFLPFLDNILLVVINILEEIAKICFIFKIEIVLASASVLVIILYYLYITYMFYKINLKKIIVFMIILLIHINIHYFIFYPKVTFLDIGQGDSSLIELPHNKGNILIDTGGNYDRDIANTILIPYFKSVGIKKIDYLILSHGDYDHMGEAINLVNNFKVEKVIFNCGEYNDLEKELIKVLDKNKIKYSSCINELNIDNNKLYFLQTKEYDNENDNSNVIYTELNNYKFMLMGDASINTEKEIMNIYNLPDIDVLKVGHHGSKTSSGIEFINDINPKYSIISVGKNNRYGHPNKGVLDNLENSKIYRTDEDGSIMFKIKNNKLKIETCYP